jgi:hypothetical protein
MFSCDQDQAAYIVSLTDVIGHKFINVQLIADQLAANGYCRLRPNEPRDVNLLE